jgi:hypothetical protein
MFNYMQNQQEELKQEAQEQQSFEEEQAEAFKNFMKAHFGNPICQECLNKYQ